MLVSLWFICSSRLQFLSVCSARGTHTRQHRQSSIKNLSSTETVFVSPSLSGRGETRQRHQSIHLRCSLVCSLFFFFLRRFEQSDTWFQIHFGDHVWIREAWNKSSEEDHRSVDFRGCPPIRKKKKLNKSLAIGCVFSTVQVFYWIFCGWRYSGFAHKSRKWNQIESLIPKFLTGNVLAKLPDHSLAVAQFFFHENNHDVNHYNCQNMGQKKIQWILLAKSHRCWCW